MKIKIKRKSINSDNVLASHVGWNVKSTFLASEYIWEMNDSDESICVEETEGEETKVQCGQS